MTKTEKQDLLDDLRKHLQWALEIELSTIPIYLYTYYSIKRLPGDCGRRGDDYFVATYANKAGATIMSVAVEEMLHMSLAANILKSLGGTPKIYGRSPISFPTNLLKHSKGPCFELTKLSADQLKQFLLIEQPEAPGAPSQGDNWDTLGQFYDYIIRLIGPLEDSDFQQGTDFQLAKGKGYYASSNVDTIYPNNAKSLGETPDKYNPTQPLESSARYSNQDDSGNLMIINDKASALKAISVIKDQGEGNYVTHKSDDPSGKEDSHWYKFKSLVEGCQGLTPDEWNCFVINFPESPKRENYPEEYRCVIDLMNGVYSYLLLITEKSYTLSGNAQFAMFYIGMHKGMIFILDKLIGLARYCTPQGSKFPLAPTFENYSFQSDATAKQELVDLCLTVNSKHPEIYVKNGFDPLPIIQDLPDVNINCTTTVTF